MTVFTRALNLTSGLLLAAVLVASPAPRATYAEQAREPSATFGSGFLLANMHGLLFHESQADLQEDVRYARWLGASLIRTFATDNNTFRAWSGEQVGRQIVRLAPELRTNGMKLIVALVNNHRAVPGEAPGSSGFLDNYQQLLLPFYTDTWRSSYLTFVRGLIGTVRDAGALDVISAWELGNELHTPENPPSLIPFVLGAVAEIRAVDPNTPLLAGTMGANHVEPGKPGSSIARWLYCDAPLDGYTLHAYDWVGPERPGDMPIDWDLNTITAEPCPSGRRLPVVVEELGTSRELPGLYQRDDESMRLWYELRQLRRALSYPQVVGVGVWNAESPKLMDHSFFDTRRGLTSYGAHALGGGSCYDPRPEAAAGTRCQLETVLRQLAAVWPDTRSTAWLPADNSAPAGAVVGAVDPFIGGGQLRVSGWVVDTRATDSPGIDQVDAFLGGPGLDPRWLATTQPLQYRSEIERGLGNPAWADAGFQMDLALAALPLGVDRLTLLARASDGTAWSRTVPLVSIGQATPTLVAASVDPPAPPDLAVPAVPVAGPPRLVITSPDAGATVQAGQIVEGTVSDPGADSATSIDRVELFLEPDRDDGGKLLGAARLTRPGSSAASDNASRSVSFSFVLSAPRGAHTLYIHAHSAATGRETVVPVPLTVF